MFAAHLTSQSGLADVLTLDDESITKVSGSPPATATYTIKTNGNVVNHNPTTLGQWLNNPARASLYEVRATVTAGSLTSGTTGSWLAVTADRSWSVTVATVGIEQAEFDIEVRLIGSGTTLETGHITLTADAS